MRFLHTMLYDQFFRAAGVWAVLWSVLSQTCCGSKLYLLHYIYPFYQTERQTDRQSWAATGQTKRRVVRGVCCSRGHSSFLVGVVWLTWWELLPGRRQPGPCLGNRPFIAFLIGGGAVKRLTSLACLFGCFSSNETHWREWRMWPSGHTNTKIIWVQKYSDRKKKKNTCSQTKHLNVVGGFLEVVLHKCLPLSEQTRGLPGVILFTKFMKCPCEMSQTCWCHNDQICV